MSGQACRFATAVSYIPSSDFHLYRFLFFTLSDDTSSQVDALAKSDKKAFRSVASVLHIDEEDAVGGRLSDIMFDVKDVKTKKAPTGTNRRRRDY